MNKFRFLTMSILFLVITGLTGCKDDDSEVTLTGVTVEPTSVTGLEVGDEVTLKVTAVPANATNLEFEWTADPVGIVSFSDSIGAEVKVKGLKKGKTEVKVTAGYLMKKITVTVTKRLTGITVDPASVADLVVDDEVTLTAAAVPTDADNVMFSWSANPAGNVSITPTTITGTKVKVKGLVAGNTVITVSCGDITQTVNVTVLPLTLDYIRQTALGYWEFENSNNFGAATYGADLEVIDASAFSQVDGPVAGDRAIQGIVAEAVIADLKLDVQERVTAYTIMWDVKIPIPEEYDEWGSYFTGFWNGTYTTGGNSSIFFMYMHKEHADPDPPKLDIGGGAGLGYSELARYEANPPWLRVVITVDKSAGSRKTYCNGVPIVEPEGNVLNIDARLDITDAFYFARNPKNAGTDAVPHPVSTIAVWNKVLSDSEVALLGSIPR